MRATAGDHRRKIVDIDKDIGGEDEIILRVVAGLVCKEAGQIGGGETVVEAFALRLGDHAGREIDAGQALDKRTKNGAGQSGAAAEIEHGAKLERAPGRAHGAFDGVAEQRRPAIGKALGEGRVVTGGILIEQPADIGFAHRRSRHRPRQPGKLQAGAVIILRIGVAGLRRRRR